MPRCATTLLREHLAPDRQVLELEARRQGAPRRCRSPLGNALRQTVWAMAATTLLGACAPSPSVRPTNDSELEEAANDLEDSKYEYEACLREQEEDDNLSCEELKEMYEEDRRAYDQALAKQARLAGKGAR